MIFWAFASIPFAYVLAVSTVVIYFFTRSPTGRKTGKPSEIRAGLLAAFGVFFVVLIIVLPVAAVLIVHGSFPSIGERILIAILIASAVAAFPISKWLAGKVVR